MSMRDNYAEQLLVRGIFVWVRFSAQNNLNGMHFSLRIQIKIPKFSLSVLLA